jgi:hypothetical protein
MVKKSREEKKTKKGNKEGKEDVGERRKRVGKVTER